MVTVTRCGIEGVLLIQPKVFADPRGFFLETWRAADYTALGVQPMVQDAVSCSQKGMVRGLHYQDPHAQGKLVSVLEGEIWDVAVDLRPHSPTYAKWEAVTLSSRLRNQLYIPPGFAHGYCVMSDEALVSYKLSDYYDADCEKGIRWNDPTLNIPWPVKTPALSDRDRQFPLLGQ